MKLSLLYYDIVCYVIAICVFIVAFVYILLYWSLFKGGRSLSRRESQRIELLWTVVPTFIVLILCSMKVNFITRGLDCLSRETIKIVGHQWYWSYEYPLGQYRSYALGDGFLVDKPLRLIYGNFYHLVVTSSDVIHSFSVPSLNLKMDAIPGRLNHLFYCPSQYGSFVGYCAELCGVNHSVMPIIIEVVGFCFSIFIMWVFRIQGGPLWTRQIMLLLSVVFTNLLLFSFTKSTIYYCGLSVIKALLCRFVAYSQFGFGWYSLLFCLVYIGGIYILFVFVSLFRPKSNSLSYFSSNLLIFPIMLFVLFILGSGLTYCIVEIEFSRCICNIMEGSFYLCLCFTLLFGFIILRILSRLKLKYFR